MLSKYELYLRVPPDIVVSLKSPRQTASNPKGSLSMWVWGWLRVNGFGRVLRRHFLGDGVGCVS